MPTIRGTVTKGGEPQERAFVRILGPSGEFTAEVYTKEDGAFTFHVVDGRWTIETRAAGAETDRRTVEVKEGDAQVEVTLEGAVAG